VKNAIKTLFAGGLSALASIGIAKAGQLEDAEAAGQRGHAAFMRGDLPAARREFATKMRLLLPLAQQGNACAQVQIGSLYRTSALRDLGQAVLWYRKAADQGDAGAQGTLAIMYEEGWGVPKNYTQAVTWYRKAADQGDAGAQNDLGLLYEKGGTGVPKDYAQAVTWFRKAADQGHPEAQAHLGEIYEAGRGVLQDYIQAYMWFNLAATPRDPESQISNQFQAEIYGQQRDQLADKMTPAQIAEAQQLAREWVPTKKAQPKEALCGGY